MPTPAEIPRWKDKVLFTPGPLTTSPTVKQAMLRDLGSRDFEFMEAVRDVRRRLVALGQAAEPNYTAVPMQGSGTFGIESVLSTCIPRGGKLLVLVNGAYGARIVQIATTLGIDTAVQQTPEDEPLDPAAAAEILRSDGSITTVAAVHCETTTGILNPAREIGRVVRALGRAFVLDAMSSFGAVPVDLPGWGVDYLVSSSNKCIEGVPGFSFVLARTDRLAEAAGWARSVSLDLAAQWKGLETNGQFRFTPPTHALLAFRQALLELEQEGGVEARGRRYRANQSALIRGMRALGFREYLRPEHQGPIITSFYFPDHERFDFETFYERLNRQGYVIYPGKLSGAACFRIGSIGRIFPSDVEDLLGAIARALGEMGVQLEGAGAACNESN